VNAGTSATAAPSPALGTEITRPPAWWRFASGDRATQISLLVLIALVIALVIGYGLHATAQTSLQGLVTGSYFALGAIGLTLVYGTLRLINIAHGETLTIGAYLALLLNVTLGVPFLAAAVGAIVITTLMVLSFEFMLWRPMRAHSAGLAQLLLVSVGLSLLLRSAVQFVAGGVPQSLDVNTTASVEILGLTIGRTGLIVMIIGIAIVLVVCVALRWTLLGKQIRALADNFELARATGIATDRVIKVIWVVAGALGALAGILAAAAIGTFTPALGSALLLSLFAAITVGGVGNAYGALVGGLLIGLAQEWSTLLVEPRWKIVVGFAVLIVVLLLRPQGLFNRRARI
jgi:neutral amino acid transport system permease protein